MNPPGALSRTAELASLGPFFAAEAHARAVPPEDPWRSMGELAGDSAALRARVADVRGYLAAAGGQEPADVEERVAASVAHLGLVARVVSPVLALAVLRGDVLTGIGLAELRWQPALGGPYPLSLPEPPERPESPESPESPERPERPESPEQPGDQAEPEASADPGREAPPPDALADALARHLLEGPVRELGDAAACLKVSPHIAWGNAASAVNGAAGMLAAARPAHARRARALAALLLERPPLRGAGTVSSAPGHRFRRRSCCLIYRAAPGHAGALCGDCALDRPA